MNDNEKTITISQTEYKSLIIDNSDYNKKIRKIFDLVTIVEWQTGDESIFTTKKAIYKIKNEKTFKKDILNILEIPIQNNKKNK